LIGKQHPLACDYGTPADRLLHWQNEDDCPQEKLPISLCKHPSF